LSREPGYLPFVRNPSTRSRFLGCLLGGAVGDALGAPVEFFDWREIRRRFGKKGLREYAPAYGRLGAITDDTQMTLFTVEGMIRASNRMTEKGICNPAAAVWHAYERWLHTQGRPWFTPLGPGEGTPDGWLARVLGLHAQRAPGNTCLSALETGGWGTFDEPINDSKGCGGVMRVAPVGLMKGVDAFRYGAEFAATTHGHPSGYLSAGFLAHMIRAIVEGRSVPASVNSALRELERWDGAEETRDAVLAACRLGERGDLVPEDLETLGGGWTGESALAIAIAATWSATNFPEAVLLAVNHSGDSDSTGSIAGQILGTHRGARAIPPQWLEPLELRREITTVACDLYRLNHEPGSLDSEGIYDWERYPGW
jgi:ADP-ribosylglycohydrolase